MQLLRSRLVASLEPSFQAITDDIARARRWPTSSEVVRLGALVRKLSDAYNQPTLAPPRTDEALAARLGFSFARDVPKGAAAVRELVATGALAMPTARALRVLDLGAGLGATSRGIARALAAAGASGEIAIDAVDSDGSALDVASAIARARPRETAITVSLHAHRAPADADFTARGPYDVVVLGQVLSELDRDASADTARVERHASLLRRCAGLVHEEGAVVVVEPALRERTRHLHEVRDRAIATPGPLLNVFAPCVHDDACPMLGASDAWCHEDLDVDLPEWLVPVARAAGLRWQGLTFSYLVLRKDGRRQMTSHDASVTALRVVSHPIVTKGKRELFLCGRFEDAERAEQLRAMRLDRHRVPMNEAWDTAARGDVVLVLPAMSAARPRVDAGTSVALVTGRDGPAPGG